MADYGINNNTLNLQHIQLKFKNAADWQAADILLAGEVGVELDTSKAKIGDGTKTWAQLGYSADPTLAGLISSLTERMTTAEGTLTTIENTLQSHGTRLTTAESDIDAAEGRLDTAEADIDAVEGRATALETKDVTHEARMTTIEAKDTTQDERLAALEGITTISANSFSGQN